MLQNPESPKPNKPGEEFLQNDEVISSADGVLSHIQMLRNLAGAGLINLSPEEEVRLLELEGTLTWLKAEYGGLNEDAIGLYTQYEEAKKKRDIKESVTLQEYLETVRIKHRAHRKKLDSLAPGSVIEAIDRNEKPLTESSEALSREILASYLQIVENGQNFEATTIPVADQIIAWLKEHINCKTIIAQGPPGNGKTTFLDSLEILLRKEGWIVVQINFDKIIRTFFEKQGKPTKDWGSITAEMLDRSFIELEKEVTKYYPENYKSKRVLVIMDTLGYNIDQMLYGLRLLKLMKPAIEQNSALVLTVVAQPSVVEKAKGDREEKSREIAKNVTSAQLIKQSGGAPPSAVTRHHQQIDKKIAQLRKNKKFSALINSLDLSAATHDFSEEEIVTVKKRLAYFIRTRNILNIPKNWWYILNVFDPKRK